MGDFLNDDVQQAISLQANPNQPSDDGATYVGFLANVIPPVIPALETVTDEEMTGDGYSRTLRKVMNYYWGQKQWTVSGFLNDHVSAMLMNLWQGGVVTTTNRTAPSKDISAVTRLGSGSPKLISLYRHLGGEQFINSTFGINEWTIAQQGEARPTAQFNLISTGHFLDKDELNAKTFDETDVVAAPDYEYFHGAATQVFATDGVDVFNWTTDGELISLSLTGSNNLTIARRPGDAFKDVANHNSGAFPRKIRYGKLTGSGRIVVDLGNDLKPFKSMVAGRKLTGLTVLFQGFNKIGATADFFEYEVKIPKSGFSMIEGETDDQYGALALNIQPERDAITKGYFTNRTRTNKTLVL